MFIYLLITIFFMCVLHILINYNYKARLYRKIPGPNGVFIFGNAPEVILSSVELFEYFRNLAKSWSTINRLYAFPYGVVNIYKPEDIELVIANTKHNQKNIFYTFLKTWLHEGLLINHGNKWHQRRKILTNAFHFKILKQFCVIFEQNSTRLVEALRKYQEEPIDIVPIVSEFTLHTICETAMGTQLSNDNTVFAKKYINAIKGIGHAFVQRCSRVYFYPNFTYNFSSIRSLEKKYANIIHNFTKTVIDDKRKSMNEQVHINDKSDTNDDEDKDTFNASHKKRKTAMLDLLLSAEKDGIIDVKGIQEEVDTFMFEGHDTTASGITTFLMLIANYKHIQDKIFKELNEIFSSSKRAASVEDLAEMRYLDRCIKESLRLYPPVPIIGRILSDDVKLGGHTVPAGTHCFIQIYDMHRSEDLYKNPLIFDPDRFLPENCQNRHPFAYLPFSAGPRNCIGQKFAQLEMKSVISSVLREFKLEPITKPADLKFNLDLVLKSATPVQVSFIPRNIGNND